jgi:hypothetical protein
MGKVVSLSLDLRRDQKPIELFDDKWVEVSSVLAY